MNEPEKEQKTSRHIKYTAINDKENEMIVNVKNPYHQHRRVPIPRLYRRHIEPIFHPIALFRIVLPPVAHTAETGRK